MNLALNAAQAMPGGGTVRLSAVPDTGGVLITVTDEGEGLSGEQMEKVFEPFFTTKVSGTGLGLAVVHQIVVRRGGTVTATRNDGCGMTFAIRLPRGSEGRQ